MVERQQILVLVIICVVEAVQEVEIFFIYTKERCPIVEPYRRLAVLVVLLQIAT
jgi:hypothetical protein